ADIVVGEGQALAGPMSFGGPGVGLFATREKFLRQMPGRLCGETTDEDGRRGWVLTLSTREQHIRREKATSNICTNQALCALAATVYLGLHGPRGLSRLAELNLQRAAATRRRIEGLAGLASAFPGPCFNEFAVRSEGPVAGLLAKLEAEGILAGVPLGPDYPELEDCFLVAVTECNLPEELDRLVAGLAATGV
ncbi:MAG: glycine dehydrogenase, partial [Acidobacteria bacterium]|nr:glycine dehydrogenase [Acidobacteriota bacterium]